MTRARRWVAANLLVLAVGAASLAQQQADPEFNTRVANPAYTGDGPRVLFDEAHHNFHTAGGRYKPFADLITSDGYRITPSTGPFTKELLAGYDVLVISNALGAERMDSADAIKPAFTEEECAAVEAWVKEGGALLLIADHFPMGHAAESLAARFGVQMSKGMTAVDNTFSRADGTLGDHPITRGRSEAERINKVREFTGQTLLGPAGSTALLLLPDGARELVPDEQDPNDERKAKERAAAGRNMGLALTHGKGRVVVLGEAAMLTAQISRGEKIGMNVPGLDNRQFALNVMHWLSGGLE